MSVNEVRLSGTVTRDVDVRAMPSGAMLMEVSLAVNDSRWDPEHRAHAVATTYVTVQFWGELADEWLEAPPQQGDEVFVIGRLDQREIEKRDGSKDRKTRVEALMVQVLRRRRRQSFDSEPPF